MVSVFGEEQGGWLVNISGGVIMITERDRICFYIATILETAYRSEC